MPDKDMEINWNSPIIMTIDRRVIGIIGPTGVRGVLGCPERLWGVVLCNDYVLYSGYQEYDKNLWSDALLCINADLGDETCFAKDFGDTHLLDEALEVRLVILFVHDMRVK